MVSNNTFEPNFLEGVRRLKSGCRYYCYRCGYHFASPPESLRPYRCEVCKSAEWRGPAGLCLTDMFKDPFEWLREWLGTYRG